MWACAQSEFAVCGRKKAWKLSVSKQRQTVRPSSLNVCAPSCFLVVFIKVANSPRTVRLSASTCLVGPRSAPTQHRRTRPCREEEEEQEPTQREATWPRTSKITFAMPSSPPPHTVSSEPVAEFQKRCQSLSAASFPGGHGPGRIFCFFLRFL